MLGNVFGKDGLYTAGDVGEGELLRWSLQGGIGGELEDHVIVKGMEEDCYLLGGGDGQFPEQFQAFEEAEGKEELGEVGIWWHGLGVAKIMMEVAGKTITGADTIRDVGIGHIPVESKAKVVNNVDCVC